MEGKKVLHLDRNEYYGDEGASLNLTSLFKKFRNVDKFPPQLGSNREWNVDLIPKFVMASGKLVKMLLKTQVSIYLNWKAVQGTYVYQVKEGGFFSKGGPKICKVPANEKEALSSDLMGMFEKPRCAKLISFIQKFDATKPETYKRMPNIMKQPWVDVTKEFGIEEATQDFVGHAIALYTTEEYMNSPATEVIDKIKLYFDSIDRFGGSPFIYPIYGLAGIPEGFSRKCAVHGGTYMLNQAINKVLLNDDGMVTGVTAEGGKKANAPILIGHPEYFIQAGLKQKVKPVGKVIRSICILNHPVANTNDVKSLQIILPQKQLKRNSDIYVMMVSHVHQICKQGFYVAVISATVETNTPEAELQPAYDLISPICEKFVTVTNMYEPSNLEKASDNAYVTKS